MVKIDFLNIFPHSNLKLNSLRISEIWLNKPLVLYKSSSICLHWEIAWPVSRTPAWQSRWVSSTKQWSFFRLFKYNKINAWSYYTYIVLISWHLKTLLYSIPTFIWNDKILWGLTKPHHWLIIALNMSCYVFGKQTTGKMLWNYILFTASEYFKSFACMWMYRKDISWCIEKDT